MAWGTGNMNMLDYIDWRGDLTFAQSGFNEVDNLIFSTLVYLNMDGLIAENHDRATPLEELYRLYTAAGYDQSYSVNDPLPLLTKAACAPRFKDVRVQWYVNKVDAGQQLQFAAATFILSDDLAFIAFRGTDNTLVGWREDCNFSFLTETPGQNEAVAYVNRIASRTTGDLIVGGHSKGGNFAVYGAAFCDRPVSQDRIIRVYSNDGPGFNSAIADSERYLAILNKTVKIIPDASLVGILLDNKTQRTIIQSDAKGLMQHNPYSWRVKGAAFERADERTDSSLLMDDALSEWIASLTTENKQILVNAVFDALEASGATTLREISENKWDAYSAILKAAAQMDQDSKSDIKEMLKKLLASGKDAVKNETTRHTKAKKRASLEADT
ncbi:MAG: DUF2974 domain-containing protein [Clostridia bacterium]|nr:DUF2974 domain-containing protein [Clostridia bacterium]